MDTKFTSNILWASIAHQCRLDAVLRVLSLGLSTQSISHQIDEVNTAQKRIEELNQSICQIIYDSLDATCGRVTSCYNYWQDFWTTEMLQAFETREYYYRKWRKAYGLNKLHYWIRHQETSTHLKRLIHRRRLETWDKFCHQMSTGEYTKALAKISKIQWVKKLHQRNLSFRK
ncbi:hypothetical protein G6F27_012967 [Rhizopus arrhizus]|nr:hypothetical protein G6F27_012967 [Rhizopus arrhizus]